MRFSIIIPAYNSAKYIRNALGSIKEQTFTDYELIVVCDSCEDNTLEVASKYADKVYSVNYHQDGQTRNVGIDHAEGDYLMFMDDDDWWLNERVLERIDKAIGDYDLIRFGFYWQSRGYRSPGDYFAVWNKCWKREFVGDTRFSDVPSRSDVDFHVACMQKQPTVKDIDECFYYYNFMRKGSQTWERGF